MQTIPFTKEQYENLIKLAYLGEWMINSVRIDDTETAFDELLGHVLSHAKGMGHDRYVEYDKQLEKYFPSEKLEEELHDYIEDYNNETFWDELAGRLAERDLVKEYGMEKVERMSFDERTEAEHPLIDKYYDEFERNGVDRIVIADGE
ncbi:MAG TPA: hypothetical protein P5287_08150 [bacterium]|nr:hypothetical protein [bacterium]